MKLKQIILIVLLVLLIAAVIVVGVKLITTEEETPQTNTTEQIVGTVGEDQTQTGEDQAQTGEEQIATESGAESEGTGEEISEEVSEEPAEEPLDKEELEKQIANERKLVNTETDPAKIVVPDDTHDELAIRVEAIADETEEIEGVIVSDSDDDTEVTSKKKTSSGDGPNVGLLVLLGILIVAFVGVFLFNNKMKNGGGKKGGY